MFTETRPSYNPYEISRESYEIHEHGVCIGEHFL